MQRNAKLFLTVVRILAIAPVVYVIALLAIQAGAR